MDKKDRPAVVTLAWQCRQIGDEPLSDNLLAFALDHLPKDAEGRAATLAAVEYTWRTDQLAEADDLLNRLLSDESSTIADADLWRLAAQLAESRQTPDWAARAAARLETALNLDYGDLPPVIDLQSWRADYGKLLSYYQALAVAVPNAAPADLATRAIRAVDRWRAHDPDGADGACQTAATILRALGQENAAWEYLTTPAGLHPGGVSWSNLAHQLRKEGDAGLADRSFAAACEQDPDDALVEWERAMNLRQADRGIEADALLHRLAEGEWPERFRWVQAQAQRQLERK